MRSQLSEQSLKFDRLTFESTGNFASTKFDTRAEKKKSSPFFATWKFTLVWKVALTSGA